jgi:NADH:ubiquinone oxidoreductase subunit 4 (subunit M)
MFSFLFLLHEGPETGLLMYTGGISLSFILGHICLNYLKQRKESISLRECQGHMYEYPILGNIFFLVCLGFMLFPITPSFLGEELLLSSIHSGQWLEISLFGIGFFLMGVNITRLFAKVFFGPHKKTYHEIAYKSA